MLYGRERELGRIAELVNRARRGAGGALVVRGAPGTGKSALLTEAVDAVGKVRLVRTRGIEPEAPLAFAALHRLLRPQLGHLDHIPAPQAAAVRAAFGEEGGAVPDRFLVFLGALSLLAEAAEEEPVLAVVDDAQWLDEASAAALTFVARRLDQEPVALLFAAREGDVRRFDADDLPDLALGGLDLAATRQVLGQAAGGDVGAEVSAQLLASTRGNPLALLELPRVLTAAQLTGRAALPGRLPVTETLQRVFLDRADRLSEPARRLLLVAAADDAGQIASITAAGATLGAGPAMLEELERSGLVSVADGLLAFRHPLVASAVYTAATATARAATHAALADVLTGAEDRDRRAWHRAAAITAPDPAVAGELVEVAHRAARRGGHEAAAAAWERAAELSADPGRRAQYRYAAASSAWLAGRVDRARTAADLACAAAADPLLAADAAQLRARIEWNSGSPTVAQRMLLEAAAAVADRDPARARRQAMFAAAVSTVAGRSGTDIDPRTFAAVLPDDDPARGRCLTELITGLALVTDGDIAAAAPALRAALDAGAAAGIDDYDITPNLGIAAMHLGDLRAMGAVHERMLSRARQDGGLVVVLYALTRLSFSNIADGAWSTAVARQTEALELGAATGQPILAGMPQAALLLLSALRGEESYAERLSVLQPVLDGPSTGVLDLLLRDLVRWARAVHAFPRSDTGFHHLAQLNSDVIRRQAGLDRIEAAVHNEQRGPAGLWVSDLERFAVATGQTWAAAIAAHGRALLAEDADTDRHFEEALRLHRAGGRPFDQARTEFAYGEHLRRTRRRVAAREHLRAALRVFEDLKAGPWVERARIELRASGESVRHRDVAGPVTLTPQEHQVALLVQQGLTNRDVAGQLFVSPRTVDFHLRNVFTKTGVSSRTELAQLTLD